MSIARKDFADASDSVIADRSGGKVTSLTHVGHSAVCACPRRNSRGVTLALQLPSLAILAASLLFSRLPGKLFKEAHCAVKSVVVLVSLD